MKSSLSWIKDYVPDLDVTAREYADAMTLSGTKVEEFEELDDGLDKVVVGKVLSVEKHPDADKLVVCMVDVGEAEPIQIVTERVAAPCAIRSSASCSVISRRMTLPSSKA